MYHSLSPSEVRKFAFQFAIANDIETSPSWTDAEMAGADWFTNFLKRNNSLSMRTFEATNRSRATSFNRANVSKFFDSLGNVLDKYKFLSHEIYNCYETETLSLPLSLSISLSLLISLVLPLPLPLPLSLSLCFSLFLSFSLSLSLSFSPTPSLFLSLSLLSLVYNPRSLDHRTGILYALSDG